MGKGRTYYSARIDGARGNYNLPVRFDMTDGFLGITQVESEKVSDRVLLSPEQVKKLIAFVELQRR